MCLFSGCATPVGLLYTQVEAPVSVGSGAAGPLLGEACAYSFLGLLALGDRSIEAGRRNGGITTVSSVDETVEGFPLVYSKHCTLVRGN